ncbi:MAG: class I SAM-dependent methyltransferase [Chloroflexota bacterium]|nr:class I SAM-dependent methyltransferase [Chloroflexota bacterium]
MSTRYSEVLAPLRTAYDGEADGRESRSGAKTPWKLVERTAFLERIRSEGRRDLLELGAGTGHDSLFFKEHGLDVVAIDLSRRMVEHCLAKGLDARVADFLRLGLPPASFDATYALNSLLHVPNADIGLVLASIRTVMRPTALFFLGVYGGQSHEGALENDRHVPPRYFSLRGDDELQHLVTPYFDVVDFHTVALHEDDFHFQALTLRRPA